jgi:GTPase SAR1 family protein
MADFLSKFRTANSVMAICYGGVYNPKFVIEPPNEDEFDQPVFFAPVQLKQGADKIEKVFFHSSKFLWCDVDQLDNVVSLIPPTMVVMSGHGYHLYYQTDKVLTDINELETLNKILGNQVIGWDNATWNANRLLRVPGSINNKNKDTIHRVKLIVNTEFITAISDINAFAKASKDCEDLIRSGDAAEFASRSERDWAICNELIVNGASDEFIHRLFRFNKCGDRYKEKGVEYLQLTLDKIRKQGATEGGVKKKANRNTINTAFGEGAYYYANRQISTFILKPNMLIKANANESGVDDVLVTDVITKAGTILENQQLPRSAFTSTAKFDKSVTSADVMWLGSDNALKLLLPHLLESNNIKKLTGTAIIGLHEIDGKWYFIGDNDAISADRHYEKYDAPMAWINTGREHPRLNLAPVPPSENYINRLINLNTPDVMWSVIGWCTAALLKPYLEKIYNYRTPTLAIFGTKGSGKTTLIDRVLLPTFGQINPRSWDASTTAFVIRALQASTNAVPISYAEFRSNFETIRMLRSILIGYDSGYDARGTADQTTITYQIVAPNIISGEELIADNAARERIIVAKLIPSNIAEGSDRYNVMKNFRAENILGYVVQQILKRIDTGEINEIFQRSTHSVNADYTQTMPDRVRRNITFSYFGALVFSNIFGIDLPSPSSIFVNTTKYVTGATGGAKVLCDTFIEDIVNNRSEFYWNAFDGKFMFQFKPAHDKWMKKRSQEQRHSMEVESIQSQLIEAPYFVGKQTDKVYQVYVIDIQKAINHGLDIPNHIEKKESTFSV